ncbi:uncharacterized protein AMSG_06586 [Thecamonas trahens ATCC 50062]|uniref:E3 ubiquitin-protein ligase E3D n=1 Tax=Thecamonas trahens ATCC 50062 TaxID=461836 RepID=A0A0L0DFV9_THETB|nr:hypothetical protein AMSG_06586 [Thecamonas trahens ATCC 50062]KNC51227.1 hypothetical protein AMSG_06586 [Thecamonas trahens ATCC 50062]|eukprot:XP_013756423.1 hypothetical protein AMSG_06586 [Thecamonas trahens ATCC 50062]
METSVWYVVEKLSHISTVQVLVWTTPAEAVRSLRMRVEDSRAVRGARADDVVGEEDGVGNELVVIDLDCLVSPHLASAKLNEDEDTVVIRVPLDDPAPPTRTAEDAANGVETEMMLLTAAPRVEEAGILACRACGAELTPELPDGEQLFHKVAPLPSQFWHEMIDYWICHDDDGLAFPHLPKGELAGEAGLLLDAPHYVVVHASTLMPGVVTQVAANRGGAPLGVMCTACGGQLGTQSSDGSYSLRKHAICLFRDEEHMHPHAESCYYAAHSVALAAAADMRDASLAHGVFRFIADDGDGRFLLLWLFAADAALATNVELPVPDVAAVALDVVPVPILKIMYLSSSAEAADRIRDEWETSHATEFLPMLNPAADVAALTAALEASSRAFPPSYRRHEDFALGFLLNLFDVAQELDQ